ncbi:hypothetical protein Lser_V15G09202 [Lactuca serriola]
MDIDPPVPPSSAPKKPKFTPKAPSRRKTGRLLPKNDDDVEADPELLRKLHERHGTRKPKLEKNSSGNVTTSHGAGSSSSSTTPLRTIDGSSKISSDFRDNVHKNSTIGKQDGDVDDMLIDDKFKSSSKTKKKYRERWDPHSYYPITLPWRPLGSGDPEILNEQEFGEEKQYDENKINSASELGLLEKNDDEKKMILFKFPQKLPLDNKQSKRVPISTKGKEKEDASNKFVYGGLNELPNGHIGKMLVYKSGAIKLKLGDIIFDVSSGVLDECAQDVALMNVKSKDCCVVGQVDKQAVIVPDLDSILDNIAKQ